MANYPIKVLVDEKGQEFIPISSTGALLDPTGQNLDTILASKLETNSIMAGSGITLNKNTTNHTVEINCSLPGASVIDNLTTTTAGQGSLDAHQGYVLNTTKINISDIVNNVTSIDADKPLSAYQGYLLSNRIPNKISDLTNDAGYAKTTDLLNLIYPIGSIYMSINDTSPEILFGGSWERLQGGFLYGAVNESGSGNGTGTNTGTNNDNTSSTAITIEQMPEHTHNVTAERSYFFTLDSVGTTDWYGGGSSNAKWAPTFPNTATRGWSTAIANKTGGGAGHTHTLNNHSHTIPYIAVYMWKRKG